MLLGPALIRDENRSWNTCDNALLPAVMLTGEEGPFLLVLSAAHMPRKLGVFRKAGLGEGIPLPVDQRQ